MESFVLIDGIEGEFQKYPKAIEVISFKWCLSQSPGALCSKNGKGPRATISDVTFIHKLDRASPNLARYCAVGQYVPRVTLFSNTPGGTPQEFMRWTMDDTMITHVEPVGGGGMIVEEVSVSFVRMRYEYVVLTRRGQKAGTVTALFDLRA